MPPQDRLEIISPAGEIKFYALDPARGVTNIGRHPDNDIVIDSPTVAPFHAVLYHQQKPYQFILLGEAQGAARSLNNWDTLNLDGYSLVLLEAEGAEGVAPSAAPLPPAALSATAPEAAEIGPGGVEAPPPPALPAAGPLPFGLVPSRQDDIVLAEFSAREFMLDVEQTATCEVVVTNGGDIVATFQFSVPGLDDRWVTITPREMNLNEREHGAATITITPPRKPSSRAGLHRFAIAVTSANYPGRVSQVAATLTINPYYEYAVSDISPKQQNIPYGKRAGSAAFELTNAGNSEVPFQISAADDERGCQFEFQANEAEAPQARQVQISLQPEETRSVKLSLSPTKRVFFGLSGHTHAFSVTATPLAAGLSPRAVLGQAQSLPLIGPLHVTVIAILLVLLGIWIFRPTISSFTADPDQILSSEIMAGKTVRLSWRVSWLTSLSIEQNGEPLPIDTKAGAVKGIAGSIEVAPLKTTTYRLAATNLISALIPAFAASRTQKVIVDPVEPIVRLKVDRDKVLEGETVTVSWEILNAKEAVLKINGTPETLPSDQYVGHREITPKGETVILIAARNPYTTGDGIVQTRTVNASKPTPTPLPLPVIQRFEVPAGPVMAGDTVTLEWSVTGVDKVQIEPLGEFPPSGKTIDKPAQTTSYQLIASNGQSEVRSLKELVVNPPPPPTPVPGTPKIDIFTATPNEVALGSAEANNVQLTWAVSGDFTNIELSGEMLGKVSGLPPRGTRTVAAGTKDTDFVLTAQNGALNASQTVKVKVVVPVPAISSLSPATAVAGAASFTLSVSGANFVDGSSVRWDGAERPTRFINSTTLTADIPASDISVKGKFPVTVFNPAKSGGGGSNAVNFIVNNPVPVLTALSSYGTTVGGTADLVVSLTGSGFVSDSKALWNSLALDTTYGDANTLTAVIAASRIAIAGDYTISVLNPDGGTSAGKTFTVGYPTPAITSLQPSSVSVGVTTDQTVIISGQGFLSTSQVSWNGTIYNPTYDAALRRLTVVIPSHEFAAIGQVEVSVINPAPRGGPSIPATIFQITGYSTSVSVAVSSPAGTAVSGQPVTFVATVNYDHSLPYVPIGAVTFRNGSTLLGTPAVAGGTATLNGQYAAGPMTITAEYNGDNHFSSSLPSSSLLYTIGRANTVVTVNAASSTYGQPVQFSAVVNAASPGTNIPRPPLGGTIQFYLNGAPLGSALAYNGGTVTSPRTAPAALTVIGPNLITAAYSPTGSPGDPNFNGSTSGGMAHSVSPAIPDIYLSTVPSPADYGQTIAMTAFVTRSFGAPTAGTVQFRLDGAPMSPPPSTVSLGSGGTATYSFPVGFLPPWPGPHAGAHTLQAIFSSLDPNFTGNSVTTPQTVNQILPASVTFSCSRAPADPFVTLTMNVTTPASPAGMPNPTGLARFALEAPPLSGSVYTGTVCTIGGSGICSVSVYSDTTVSIRSNFEPTTGSDYLGLSGVDVSGLDADLQTCIAYWP